MEGVIIVVLILIALIVATVVVNIRVVPQSEQYVVERLGRYKTVWDAGLHVKTPIIDRVVNKVTLKERLLDSPPQPVITKDNVTMQIDTIVYFSVFNPYDYTYKVVNPIAALENLTATTLRNIIGDMVLDETLTSRDTVNAKLTEILDEATDKWGIKVSRVEIKNIIPPAEIKNAMERQMKAERDRRETILQAQGHKEAAVTRAEGDKQAMVLQAEGERDAAIAKAQGEARAIYLKKKAEAEGIEALKEAGITAGVLELKRYDALIKMADGKASKIIVPTDAVSSTKNSVIFSEVAGVGDFTKPEVEQPAPPIEDPCCERFENKNKREV